MSSKEVNDILDKLLAVADKLGRHHREDIEYYVDKLSRAATRERAAAFDKMQELNKRLAQQSIEMSRLRSMPALTATSDTPAPRKPQPTLSVGYAEAHKARLKALASNTWSPFVYDSETGRSSSSADAPQSKPNATAVNTQHFAPSATSPVVSAVSTEAQPSKPVTQEYAGYGHFNPGRMLAIQAGSDASAALATIENDQAPAAPAYKATAANSEPVGSRRRQKSNSSAESNSTLQSAYQLLDEVDRRSSIQTRSMKRKASDSGGDAPAMSKRKRKQLAAASGPGPRCITCIAGVFKTCNGTSHCNHCAGKRCVYILCADEWCTQDGCLKIHSSQYDLSARKSGEPRRKVLGDNMDKDQLSNQEQAVLNKANVLLANVPSRRAAPPTIPQPMTPLPLVRLPQVSFPSAPRPRVLLPPCPPFSNAPRNMPDSMPGVEQHSNTGIKQERPGHNSHPFQVPEAVRSATSRTSLPPMSDPARPSPSMTDVVPARSTAFSAHAGPSPFYAIRRGENRSAFASRSSTAFGLQPNSSAVGVVGSSFSAGFTDPYMAGMNGSTLAAGPTMSGATRASSHIPGNLGRSSLAATTFASGATRPNQYGTLAWNPFMNATGPLTDRSTAPNQTRGFGSNSSTAGTVRFNPSAVDSVIIKAEEDDD